MHHVLVMGAGNIGSLIACLLARSGDYHVHLADQFQDQPMKKVFTRLKHFQYVQLDAENETAISSYIKQNKIEAVVSSLPYFCNPLIADIARQNQIHYFDLTEDVKVTEAVHEASKAQTHAFVPQCGLAPGFINIITDHMMQTFPVIDTVKMRVGALPMNISNALHYSPTWSVDGLINQYGNPCEAIAYGEKTFLQPLEGLESIQIDGLTYEAFNTSGGIGSLATTYESRVKFLDYKTIRYPGHREKIKFLMQDLKLNQDRKTLKRIIESALPKTLQDVVLVYVSVSGTKNNVFCEENYVKKFYPKKIDGTTWSAIAMTTACSITAVIDIVFKEPSQYLGYVKQEDFSLDLFLKNQFGEYFAS